MNIQPKHQYKCNKCDKPYFKKCALTTHMKKAYNIPKTTTIKDFMEIFTNMVSDNDDKKTLRKTNLRWNTPKHKNQ